MSVKIKKTIKRILKIVLCFVLIVALVNILAPLFCRKPDEKYAENLKQTQFTSDTSGSEKIRCIDDNEEALLWRLRMIGAAEKKKSFGTLFTPAGGRGKRTFVEAAHTRLKEKRNKSFCCWSVQLKRL